MAFAAFAGQVVLGILIDVKRRQFHRRMVILPLPAVAFEKSIDKMLGVGIFSDFGADNRHLFPRAAPRVRSAFEGTIRAAAEPKEAAGRRTCCSACRSASSGRNELPPRNGPGI